MIIPLSFFREIDHVPSVVVGTVAARASCKSFQGTVFGGFTAHNDIASEDHLVSMIKINDLLNVIT